VNEVRLTVPGSRPVSAEVAAFVDAFGARLGLFRGQAYRLRLAVDELATNVVEHGYRDACGVLDLFAGVRDHLAWVRIEDEAPPFDPRGYVRPALADPLLRPPGGYGLLLALTSVDVYEYHYAGGRNHSTVGVHRFGRAAE